MVACCNLKEHFEVVTFDFSSFLQLNKAKTDHQCGGSSRVQFCSGTSRKAHSDGVMMELGGHLGFGDSMDCCWSAQLEIDFGLSVGRHCQCQADQQPISTAGLWQVWSEWKTPPNILINVPVKMLLSFCTDKSEHSMVAWGRKSGGECVHKSFHFIGKSHLPITIIRGLRDLVSYTVSKVSENVTCWHFLHLNS